MHLSNAGACPVRETIQGSRFKVGLGLATPTHSYAAQLIVVDKHVETNESPRSPTFLMKDADGRTAVPSLGSARVCVTYSGPREQSLGCSHMRRLRAAIPDMHPLQFVHLELKNREQYWKCRRSKRIRNHVSKTFKL